jgi:hypothetical protein
LYATVANEYQVTLAEHDGFRIIKQNDDKTPDSLFKPIGDAEIYSIIQGLEQFVMLRMGLSISLEHKPNALLELPTYGLPACCYKDKTYGAVKAFAERKDEPNNKDRKECVIFHLCFVLDSIFWIDRQDPFAFRSSGAKLPNPVPSLRFTTYMITKKQRQDIEETFMETWKQDPLAARYTSQRLFSVDHGVLATFCGFRVANFSFPSGAKQMSEAISSWDL